MYLIPDDQLCLRLAEEGEPGALAVVVAQHGPRDVGGHAVLGVHVVLVGDAEGRVGRAGEHVAGVEGVVGVDGGVPVVQAQPHRALLHRGL